MSVEAKTATLADSLSTALVLASRDEDEEIKSKASLRRIILVSFDSDLTTN